MTRSSTWTPQARPLPAPSAAAPQVADGAMTIDWFLCAAAMALVSQQVFGVKGSIAYVLLAGALILRAPLPTWRQLVVAAPLALLPIWYLVTTLWSSWKGRTIEHSAELIFTTIVAFSLVRKLSQRQIISALMAGLLLISLASLASNRTAPYYSTFVLVGLTGSKNALAFVAQLLSTSALAVLLDRRQPLLLRLVGLFAGLVALALLVKTHSAGAIVGAVAAAALLIGLWIYGKLPALGQGLAAAYAVAIAALLVIARDDVVKFVLDFIQTVLNKDPGLTGRAYIWGRAEALSRVHPVLGYGFHAFWRKGNIESEGIWQHEKIAARFGFNFHNAFWESRIDGGLVAMVLLSLLLLLVLVLATAMLLRRRDLTSAFMLAFVLSLCIRLPTESIAPDPLNIFTLLLMTVGANGLLAFWGTRRAVAARPRPVRRSLDLGARPYALGLSSPRTFTRP